MAAGKVGGYRNNEFRDRESEYVVSRRDHYHSKNEYYRYRERDGRKREEIDDWYYKSSLSGRRSGSYDRIDNGRSHRYNDKIADREQGEISSGSDDDGSVVSETRAEVELTPRKKQKFSPKEENAVMNKKISPLEERHGSGVSELEQQDEDDFVPERKISGSRWADEEEGEIPEEEEIHRRGKSQSASGSSGTSFNSKALSPEDGEHNKCHVKLNDDIEVDETDNGKVTCYESDTDVEGEDDFIDTPELTGSPQRSFNMFSGCRSVHEFERVNKIGSGTYGVVFQAKDKRNGEIVALKKVKMEKEREGFPLTALREINILVSLRHPSIVEVKEVVVEEDVKKGKSETYLVMEYMDHDLKGLMETMKHPFSQSEVKSLMLQLLQGVEYLHDNWILHRDLKTSNLLLNNCGELKICDFGLSRQYGSPLRPYTPLVVSLWYRAPELLLGAKQYSTAIDMWSLGCILAELLANEPLFRGESEIDQLNKIFRTLGTPNESCWLGFSKLPGVKVNFVKQKHGLLRKKFPPTSFTGSHFLSSTGFGLLERLLAYDPEKRITARDAVNHEWFREAPLPKARECMPTFASKHAKAGY